MMSLAQFIRISGFLYALKIFKEAGRRLTQNDMEELEKIAKYMKRGASKMSNKAAGTRFEQEFAAILAKHSFWVHLFQDNKKGQPCDVIAARDGSSYLIDCKDCQGSIFSLSRMEENQYNAMKLFQLTGNRRGMFAIRFPYTGIYLVDFEVLKKLKDDGIAQIKKNSIMRYGRSLQSWLDDLDVFREMAKVEYVNENRDWE